ncbi:cutinase family protein [uncultured Abiotrophia sp.]|uniref:cutinase family protein n=1 Tax=uncultured Abiotrophia sp. TaxID=316094 RepID=UPI0028D80FEA|nr:cutinase family protein [uncultured Abiotrophia sp.]
MTNSNLKDFDNFYANLAQSAYTGRPIKFPYESQREKNRALLNSGQSLYFDFSQDTKIYNKDKKEWEITPGGKHLPHNGRVYLQPDPDLRDTYKVTSIPVPDANGMRQDIRHKRYQKGLLTDDEAGFSAYYLTDTPTLTNDTTKTYMTIRGSDAISKENWNDWVENDAKFALNHIHTPQAKLATVGMKAKIAEMREKAPNATMDITGHSLGTIVSAQGVAGLTDQELEKIGKVVLFDGPDTTKSLKKMGLSDEKIKKISEKIEYYVNPFDVVGMLNREHTITKLPGDSDEPLKKPVGKVNVLVPLHYTQIADPESSHDFGVFQSDGKGNLLTASEDFHPELLRAGEKLARLIATTLDSLRALGVDENVASNVLNAIMRGEFKIKAAIGYAVYENFTTEYSKIVEEARQESIKWDREAIPRYQEQLRNGNLTGEKRILVRAQLLQTAAQLANFDMEDKVKYVKTLLSDAKEDIQNIVKETRSTAFDMVGYLSSSEVTNLLSGFDTTSFWDEGLASDTKTAATSFLTQIEQLGESLVKASGSFETIDTDSAEDFNNLLADVKQTWRGKNVSPNG